MAVTACSTAPGASETQLDTSRIEGAGVTDTSQPMPISTKTASPTLLPTNTATQSVEDWFTSQVDIDEFHLFNAGDDPSTSSQRDYSTSFAKEDAMVIYCELDLNHTGLKQNKAFVMQAIYYDQNGDIYGEVEIEPVVKSGWTDSNWVIGYGWDDPGHWDAGIYGVYVYVGEERIASEKFVILADPTSTPTSTPQPLAVVNTASLNVRKGPGTEYALQGSVSEGEELEIVGQAYNCDWLKIETAKGIDGWVSSELVFYETSCNDIASVPIPATPIPKPATATQAPESKPTDKPSGKTVKVRIVNDTGGTLTLSLNGPASYHFTFGPGTQNINVIQGTYNYTAWGCGTSDSGSKKIKAGLEWSWFCK